jgi:branched-chain amino acid transport system ATP-binding protein
MLEVRDLTVTYGEALAVKGVSLAVPKGRIVVLLGANGAGKSSTLAAIAGLVPSSGEIRYEGQSIAGETPEAIVRRGIALTPEGRRVFANLTVAENLHLGGVSHCGAMELKRRTEAELERFPILRERARQRAGLLSGGEQQMLAVARSLMSAPRLLLLDEPSLGLAPRIVEQIFDLVLDLKARGLTILLIEQNAERALEVADHGYVLQSGEIVLEGSGADLAGSDLVRQAYLAA